MRPAVAATWAHASNVSLDFTTQGPVIRLGGHVGTEAPVYSVAVSIKSQGGTPVDPAIFRASVNAFITSPSGDELATIGHFYCGEWCNEIVISRVGLGALASLVYNDTGFRHHQKKEYAASRDLFLKATWANPRAPLPPYNLACAYALLADAKNAEKALKLAIAVGGAKVKERAKKDADFGAVLTAPWFRALTN